MDLSSLREVGWRERARRVGLWGRAWLDALRLRGRFAEVRAFCFFVGWPRSGHSIVGALLNAHPDAVISHELHALEQVRRGRGRDHLYASILLRDRWFQRRSWRSEGYDYAVPGQWQGRFARLQVIGDKNGGASSRLLGRQPGLLAELRARVGVPLRLIQVTRNPWDTVATISRKHDLSLDQAQRWFASMARDQLLLERYLRPGELHRLGHAALLEAPDAELRRLADFLGLAPRPDWLAACAAKLFRKPRPRRKAVCWGRRELAALERELAHSPCLRPWLGKGPAPGRG